MELRTALKLSAGAHGAFAIWALAAGWFSADFDEAIEVTEVTLISGEEFAMLAAQSGAGALVPEVPEVAGADVAETAEQEVASEVETGERVPETDADRVAAAEASQQAPASSEERPAEPEPDVADQSRPETAPAAEAAELDAETGDTPTPAPRVAPRPVERPDPTVAVAPETVEATDPVPTEQAVETADAAEPTAPEEATTRIVTEATQTGGAQQIALAPSSAPRPPVRPSRPRLADTTREAPVAATAVKDASTAETAQSDAAAATAPEILAGSEIPDALDAAVEDALAGVLAGGGAEAGDPGPPMTAGERDALRLAVQECWVVDVGSESANVTVVVAMSMTPQGRVIDGSLEMLEASGGSETAVRTAFQSARRAILRCERDGFPLPAEKYAQWQEIEMVFNPSDMRIR